MKIKCIIHAMAVMALLVSCNNDLFIDDLPHEDVTLAMDGDDGTAEVRIVRKGLVSISIDLYDADNRTTTYNRSGAVIPNESPLNEIASINYTSRNLIFNIYPEGDVLKLHSVEHPENSELNVPLRLNYEYESSYITVELSPGRLPELVRITYDMHLLHDEGEHFEKTFGIDYDNDAPLPSSVTVWPYLNSFCSVTLQPTDIWSKYMPVSVPLPLYSEESRWQVSDKDYDVKPGIRYDFFPAGIDRMLRVEVTIPAQAQGNVSSYVFFRRATVPFFMTMRNPVSGREFDSDGMCTVKQPLRYEVVIE